MNLNPRLVSLLLCGLTSCGGFSLVTLEADPPVKLMRLGQDQIEEQTPYTFRPDDFVPERNQDLHLWIETGGESPTTVAPSEYRWRLWYGYGGSLDQVQVPKVGPDGDLWLHRGRDHLLFVQSTPDEVLLVGNAWVQRMRLPTEETLTSDPTKRAAGTPPPAPPLRYRRIKPGHVDLETSHWLIQADLPAGTTLLYEEGAGQGKFVHVAFPTSMTENISAYQEGKNEAAEPIPTKFLSMARILETGQFAESYYSYTPDKQLRVEADLGANKSVVLRCLPKTTSGERPPLILCICPGH